VRRLTLAISARSERVGRPPLGALGRALASQSASASSKEPPSALVASVNELVVFF